MEQKEISSLIDYFFNFFKDRIQFIEENCLLIDKNGKKTPRIEGYILACCYLDSLSIFKYNPPSKGEKFIKFILEYSDYKSFYEKISLPELKNRIKQCKEPRFNDSINFFIKFLENKLGVKEKIHSDLSHNVDLSLSELRKKIESDSDLKNNLIPEFKSLLEKEIPKYSYTEILWRTTVIWQSTGVQLKETKE